MARRPTPSASDSGCRWCSLTLWGQGRGRGSDGFSSLESNIIPNLVKNLGMETVFGGYFCQAFKCGLALVFSRILKFYNKC